MLVVASVATVVDNYDPRKLQCGYPFPGERELAPVWGRRG